MQIITIDLFLLATQFFVNMIFHFSKNEKSFHSYGGASFHAVICEGFELQIYFIFVIQILQ